jgi:hypothetical protein
MNWKCCGQIWGCISTLVWRDWESLRTGFHGSRFPGWDLKSASPKYETRTLSARLHIWFPVSLTFILILSFHLRLGLPGPHFPSDFQYNCIRKRILPLHSHTPLFAVEYIFLHMITGVNRNVYNDMNVLKLIAFFCFLQVSIRRCLCALFFPNCCLVSYFTVQIPCLKRLNVRRGRATWACFRETQQLGNQNNYNCRTNAFSSLEMTLVTGRRWG